MAERYGIEAAVVFLIRFAFFVNKRNGKGIGNFNFRFTVNFYSAFVILCRVNYLNVIFLRSACCVNCYRILQICGCRTKNIYGV